MQVEPPTTMVNLADVLVWPIDVIEGNEGVRVPLEAFHYLRIFHGIDLSHRAYTFARRGHRFWKEVADDAASLVRQQQADDSNSE